MYEACMNRALSWITLGAVLLSAPVWAQTDTTPPAPVTLEADSAEVNDAQGTSVYRGNVILTRGAMQITGSVMRVYTNAERELERIEVDGSPATYFEQLPDAQPRQAEAPRMEYHTANPERLILMNGGHIWQADNSVRGQTITHYPAESRTVAETDRGANRRVNVTVYPESDDGS